MFVTWVTAHLRHNDPSSMKRHLQPFKTFKTMMPSSLIMVYMVPSFKELLPLVYEKLLVERMSALR